MVNCLNPCFYLDGTTLENVEKLTTDIDVNVTLNNDINTVTVVQNKIFYDWNNLLKQVDSIVYPIYL